MAIKDWKVLGNRLLLRRVELSSAGAIIRPESELDEREIHTQECEIIMVGPLAVGHGFDVGQHVIVLENWAKVEIEGEVLVVVDADDDALLAKDTLDSLSHDHDLPGGEE